MALCFVMVLSVANVDAQTLVFPHFADGLTTGGDRWVTEIDVANTSLSQQSATISFFGSDGKPKAVSIPDRPHGIGGNDGYTSITVVLAPQSFNALRIDSALGEQRPVQTGWVSLEGTGGIKATLIFRLLKGTLSFDQVDSAGVLSQTSTNRIDFIPRYQYNSRDTTADVGFAVSNPDSALPASGEIQLVQASGEIIAVSPFNLVPRGHFAQFAVERFGPIVPSATYIRVVVSSGRIAAVALRFDGAQISTIPAN